MSHPLKVIKKIAQRDLAAWAWKVDVLEQAGMHSAAVNAKLICSSLRRISDDLQLKGF